MWQGQFAGKTWQNKNQHQPRRYTPAFKYWANHQEVFFWTVSIICEQRKLRSEQQMFVSNIERCCIPFHSVVDLFTETLIDNVHVSYFRNCVVFFEVSLHEDHEEATLSVPGYKVASSADFRYSDFLSSLVFHPTLNMPPLVTCICKRARESWVVLIHFRGRPKT